MSTVQQVINRSLRMLGVLSAGESPTSDETSDALFALNAMLGSWRNERLMAYALQDISVTLIASTASYTIGASGAGTTATNPIKIESARVTVSSMDYPVELITDKQYNAIVDKTSTSDYPQVVYWNFSQANGTAYVWPVPNQANTLKLSVWTPLAAFSAASDTITLPPGYDDALASNLAIQLSAEYDGIEVPSVVVSMARESKAAIKRVNHKPFEAVTQLSGMFAKHGVSNIVSDQGR